MYWDSSSTADANNSEKGSKGRNRKLSPEDEFLFDFELVSLKKILRTDLTFHNQLCRRYG